MPAITKTWSSIADSAVDPDSPVTTGLITGLRDNVIVVREWLGESFFAGAVQDHNHDGVNSAAIPVGPNLLRNGSFEDDLAGWTPTAFTGGTVAVSTGTRHHGAKSLAITSTSTVNGGGQVLLDQYIPVGAGETIQWSALLSASAINISSRLEVIWYDAAQSQISTNSLIDLTNSPSSVALRYGAIRAPATARFMRVRVNGGVPGAGSATGTIFWDGLQFSGASDMVLIEELVANNSAWLDFTNGINDTFDRYVILLNDINPATGTSNTLGFQFSLDGGVTVIATNYAAFGSGTTITHIPLTAAVLSNSAPSQNGYFGRVEIHDPSNSAIRRRVQGYGNYQDNAGIVQSQPLQGGHYFGGGTVNAMRLFMSAGNIFSGNARLYGVRK